MTTRAEAIEAAGIAFARACAVQDALPPRPAAELALRPGGPSLDELEDRIRRQRGLSPIHEGSEAA